MQYVTVLSGLLSIQLSEGTGTDIYGSASHYR